MFRTRRAPRFAVCAFAAAVVLAAVSAAGAAQPSPFVATWHPVAGAASAPATATRLSPALALAPVPNVRVPSHSTALPLTSFGRVAVSADPAYPYVFASGGNGGGGVVALDADGAVLQTFSGLSNAHGLVAVGSEVFVSGCGGSAIDVIDVTTLTVSNSITTPFPTDCDLGYGGGLLIFSETTPGGHRMVTLDPTTETFWEGTDEFAPAVLTSSPSNTVSTIGELLDMTTQPPTSLGATPGTGGSQYDAALAPAGTRAFIATSNPPFAVTEYAVSATPTLTRSYPLPSSPHAVAVSASGLFVAAGIDATGKNVKIFKVGATTATGSYTTPDGIATADRGLAFSISGATLFAITRQAGQAPTLHVLSQANLVDTTASLGLSRGTVTVGGSVTLTAHVANHASGGTMRIYKTPYGGSRQLAASGPVNAKGNLIVKVSPKKHTVYQAVYSGDSKYATEKSTSKTVKVRVKLALAASRYYASVNGVRLYHAGAKPPLFTTTVTPYHSGGCTRLYLQQRVSGRWKSYTPSPCFGLTNSRVAVYITGLPRNTSWRVRSWYAADFDHLAGFSPYVRFAITS